MDFFTVHLLSDPFHTVSVQISLKHPPNFSGLILLNDKVLPIRHSISIRCRTGDKLPPLHPPLIAHLLVLGDGDGLLLGQRAGNAHHQFGGERSGINILFFKLDGYAQAEQLPERRQAVTGVAGEAGDGFDQHLVDLSLPAVRQQAVEILPLVHPGARNALIGIDVHQIPSVMILDQVRIVTDLGRIGVKLIGGVRADSTIGRNVQDIWTHCSGWNYCHIGSHAVTPPFSSPLLPVIGVQEQYLTSFPPPLLLHAPQHSMRCKCSGTPSTGCRPPYRCSHPETGL